MVFFFSNAGKQRTPAELCRQTRLSINKLIQIEEKIQLVQLDDEVARNIEEMKVILSGTQDRQPNPQEQLKLITSLCDQDLFYHLALALPKISFDRRKGVQVVLSAAVRFRVSQTHQGPAVEHMFNERPEALIQLCRNFERNDCSMHVSAVLQEAFKFDSLAAIIIYDEDDREWRGLKGVDPMKQSSGKGMLWNFFRYIDRSSFEASASCFETFRVLTTTHKTLVSHFLRVNAPLFFHRYHSLLMNSNSYVTKRQSTKLLADLLLDRAHYDLMTGYVKDPENLKLTMNLLRDQRRMIAYEAFHIFKIFVADPEKSWGVNKILILNKQRLAGFLRLFLAEREEEGQFGDEKAYCLSVIEGLPEVVPERPNSHTLRPESYRRSRAGIVA